MSTPSFRAVALISATSIIGVDLERLVPLPRVGEASSNGGFCGPAVKPTALHLVARLAKAKEMRLPISSIGGISSFRDAAEFLALGSRTVQVCTAVMHTTGTVSSRRCSRGWSTTSGGRTWRQ